MQFVTPVVAVLGGLSFPLKIAWGVWLVWGVGQVAWYFWPAHDSRIYRTTQTAPRASGVRPPSTVRPPKSRVHAPAPVAPYGTSDFIAALDQEQQQAAAGGPDHTSAYR